MSGNEAEPTIKFAVCVFRHGIRSPYKFPFPTNPHQDYEKDFPEGERELTKAGKKLMAEVGRCFRSRYDRLLGEMYSSDVVDFWSTATSRSMMSTEILAQTIYPPKEHQKWDEQQTWHPIPVWADYGEIDKINYISDNTLSPRYVKLRDKALEKLNGPQLEKLKKSLTHHTGRTFKDAREMFYIWDILYFQDLNGLQLPNWSKEVYPEPLRSLDQMVLKAWIADTPEMLLLTTGPLLHFVKSQLSDKANKTMKPDRKVVLFGSHDTSMLGLLHGIKNVEGLYTSTGAMLVFELHEIEGQHIVKAFYLDFINRGRTFHEISIPICSNPCKLDDFLMSIDSLNNNEWNQRRF